MRYLAPDGETRGDGVVAAYEPPRLLAYSWGEDHLRFELHRHPDGTLLVFMHTFADRFKAARDAAGWHLCLDALASGLAGETALAPVAQPAIPAGWRGLNAAYERRFGIPPAAVHRRARSSGSSAAPRPTRRAARWEV